MKPPRRPATPNFSSGPCAKRPGWSLEALNSALVGRSHRSKPGKAKLKEVVQRSRALLGIPADYRLGIVPASDTGAVEMALWSLLGPARRRCAVLGEFRRGLGDRRQSAAKARRSAPYPRSLRRDSRSCPGRLRPRRGVPLERHHLGRAHPQRRLDQARPQGPHDLRRDLGGVRHGPALGQARCRHLVLAEGAGRRSGAWHAGLEPARDRAAGKLHAALAAAENLSPHLEGQVQRRHLQRGNHQHAVAARGRGCDRQPQMGGRGGRPPGVEGAQRGQSRRHRRNGSRAPTGSISWSPIRRSAPAPRCA